MAVLFARVLTDGGGGSNTEGGRRTAEASARPGALRSSPDLEAAHRTLLSRFGLERLPEPGGKAVVPQHMWDLYHFHTGDYSAVKDSSFGALERHTAGTNTVRCFHHLEDREEVPESEGAGLHQMVFNLSAVPAGEQIVSAELRLYSGEDGWPAAAGPNRRLGDYHLWQVLPGRASHRLLESRQLPANRSRWETFEVGPALEDSRRRGAGLVGFLVQVGEAGGPPLRVSRSLRGEEGSWPLRRPLLVTYSRDGRGLILGSGGKRPRGRRKAKHPRGRCRRKPLYVDFERVGWTEWIIAPRGYNAFYCQGDCRFPLADHMNSSSHAIVQTLVNAVNANVPKACCVPTDLSPIAMLYLDEEERVVLKNYQEMVVEGCGCR